MRVLSAWRIGLVGLAVCWGICGSAVLKAGQAQVAGQLQDVFDNYWKPSPENFASAQQSLEQLQTGAPGDRRLPLAMALVSVKNFKNTDAQKTLEQAIGDHSSKINPTTLAAWRLKIWLQALKKDDAAALSSARQLGDLLSTDKAVVPAAEVKEAAQWLGGVLGYYSGPAASQAAGLNLDALQKGLTKELDSPLADAMNDGKAAALKQFQQLQSDQATMRADMKAKNAAKRADDIQHNKDAQAAAAQKLKDLDKPTGKDKGDGKGKKNDTSDQQKQKEVQQLQEHGQRLERQLAEELRNPKHNDRDVYRLRQEISATQQKLAGMTGGQSGSAGTDTDAEKKRLQNLQTSLEAKGKQLASGSDDVVATPLDSKLALITTYAPIDLDQEKQRILDSYKTK